MTFDWDKLKAFDKIVIEYSGSGDEGYVNDIRIEPEVEGLEISSQLYSELESQAVDLLYENFAGWEINEGSAGHMTIDVKERKVFVHHGWTIETTEYEDKELE